MKSKAKISISVLVVLLVLGACWYASLSSPERKMREAQGLLKIAEICSKLKLDKLSSHYAQQSSALFLSALKEIGDDAALKAAAISASQSTNVTSVP
jgi:hypothetical protein